jgi:hypothetical protein
MNIKKLLNTRSYILQSASVVSISLLVSALPTFALPSGWKTIEHDAKIIEYGEIRVAGSDFSVNIVTNGDAPSRINRYSYTLIGDCSSGSARQVQKRKILTTGKTQNTDNTIDGQARGLDAVLMNLICSNQTGSQSETMTSSPSKVSISRVEERKNKDFRQWVIPWHERWKFDKLTPQQQTAMRENYEAKRAIEKNAQLEKNKEVNAKGLTGKGYKIEEVYRTLQKRKGESHELWYGRIELLIVSGKHMTPYDYRNWRKTLSEEDNQAYDRITRDANRERQGQFDKMLPEILQDAIKNP